MRLRQMLNGGNQKKQDGQHGQEQKHCQNAYPPLQLPDMLFSGEIAPFGSAGRRCVLMLGQLNHSSWLDGVFFHFYQTILTEDLLCQGIPSAFQAIHSLTSLFV